MRQMQLATRDVSDVLTRYATRSYPMFSDPKEEKRLDLSRYPGYLCALNVTENEEKSGENLKNRNIRFKLGENPSKLIFKDYYNYSTTIEKSARKLSTRFVLTNVDIERKPEKKKKQRYTLIFLYFAYMFHLPRADFSRGRRGPTSPASLIFPTRVPNEEDPAHERSIRSIDLNFICCVPDEKYSNTLPYVEPGIFHSYQPGHLRSAARTSTFGSWLSLWPTIGNWTFSRAGPAMGGLSLLITQRALELCGWKLGPWPLEAGPVALVATDDLPRYIDDFVRNFILFQSNSSGLCPNEPYYDVIHTHYWLSARAGMEIKREHGEPLTSIFKERLEVEKRVLMEGDAIVATSPLEARDIKSASLGIINAQISVIPCGTDIAKESSGLSVTKFSSIHSIAPDFVGQFNDSSKIVLYVGRFEERKGIKQLITAFGNARKFLSRSKDLRLVLVGGDPSEIEYHKIRKFLEHSEVWQFSTLAGRVSHDRLPEYYAAAHVTVIPSLYEPFGLVAIESMRMGTPVIASAVGGLPYIVDQGRNGLLVPANDTQALSQAIVAMLDDERRAKEMGSQGRRKVLRLFNWKKVAYKMTDLYASLISSNPNFFNYNTA
uniref:Glycosyl transferase family 1 domain-containing protein n=1 Tax=Romanomermis culicivorax TaxID=13658 RepID=A0A915JS43_ROMCU